MHNTQIDPCIEILDIKKMHIIDIQYCLLSELINEAPPISGE